LKAAVSLLLSLVRRSSILRRSSTKSASIRVSTSSGVHTRITDSTTLSSRRAHNAPEPADSVLLSRADGTLWRDAFAKQQTEGPRYNLLSPRVQQAIERVVMELVDRYADHRSFGGVAIQLGPETYAQFPDVQWAADRATLTRFARDQQLTIPGLATGDPQQLTAYLTGTGRDRWLDWRAGQLAAFYRSLADTVRQRNPKGKLYFAGANMLNAPELQSGLQPKLPEQFSPRQAMLRVGIDPARLRQSSTVMAMRPYRLAPVENLQQQYHHLSLQMLQGFR